MIAQTKPDFMTRNFIQIGKKSSLGHQRHNLLNYHNTVLPSANSMLPFTSKIIRTGPRVSAEVTVIPSKIDHGYCLVHQVGGHVAATADLFNI